MPSCGLSLPAAFSPFSAAVSSSSSASSLSSDEGESAASTCEMFSFSEPTPRSFHSLRVASVEEGAKV